LLALCVTARPAQAQGARLYLDHTACEPASTQAEPSASALRVAIDIELADADVHPEPSFKPGLVGLTLRDCELTDGTLSLLLVRTPLGEPEATELVLGDVPERARARTAAVALVEWLRALDHATPPSEPEPQPSAPSPEPLTDSPKPQGAAAKTPSPKPPAHDERTSHERPKPSVLVQLGGGLTFLGPQPLLLPGARFTLRDNFAGRFWFVGGVSYFTTSKRTSLGRAQLHVLLYEAALGVNVLPTRLITLSAVAQWGPSWAQGKSDLGVSERPQSRSLVILRGRLELKVPLAQRWALSALADFGPILRGVDYTSGGEPTFSLRSYAGEGSLNVEFAP